MGQGLFLPTRRAIDLRVVFILCVVTAVASVGIVRMWPAGASGAPSRPIDRTIDHYALFALDSLNFQGGNPGVSHIDGGDVGVNNPDPNPSDGADVMNMCAGSGHEVVMQDGTQANADTFNTTASCSLWDVYSNHLDGNPVIRNSGPTAFTTPIIPAANLPAFPSFSCNPANPVTVAKGSAMTLPPGTYGDVIIRDSATLTLAAGTYTFCSVSMGGNASLVDVDGTIVQVAETFAANGSSVGPSANAHFYVRGDGTGANDRDVSFGRGPTIAGTWWAPFGTMALGHSSDLTGHFWAQRIISDWNDNVHGTKQVCVDP